jgi:hypothetical protein
MDLEPTLEETVQESGVVQTDILDDEEPDPANRAFCECWRICREGIHKTTKDSFNNSTSCSCALCRLYRTMYCLLCMGPYLWRVDRGEVKTWLFEYEEQPSFYPIRTTFDRHVWEIYVLGIETGTIQFFRIEGMHHLPI